MAVAQAVAVAPAEAVAQAAEEAQTVAEGTGGGGAHTARAPQQLVSPVTCAPVGGQHAAHCMAARPPLQGGQSGSKAGFYPASAHHLLQQQARVQLCADAAQGQGKGARTVAILPKLSSKLG